MARFNRYSRKLPKKENLVNNDIRFPIVMVIGQNGPLGQMSPREGIAKAKDQGLDLVCISPRANPPICKIIDYGKFKFDKSKKDKVIKKNSTQVLFKEFRITPNIGKHDLETKAARAKKFIEKGYKAKVSLKFRGRERAHIDVGQQTLLKFYEFIKECCDIEKKPYAAGRFYDMILAPKKTTKKVEKPILETSEAKNKVDGKEKENA